MLLSSQHNAWLHALATVLVLVCGLMLDLRSQDWIFVVIACAMVWSMEALNTAIEFLADAVHPEQHPLIEKAKDVAAAGVLIAALAAVLIAILVFIPYL